MFGVGCPLLAVGRWCLIVGCLLIVTWSFSMVGCWLFVVGGGLLFLVVVVWLLFFDC